MLHVKCESKLKTFVFFPQVSFMCFIVFSEENGVTSLYSIYRFIFLTVTNLTVWDTNWVSKYIFD